MNAYRGNAGGPWPVALPDAAWKRSFRRRLMAWYARHARDLPWRRSNDPYRVWVSEIMLQQTQVATVEGYFARFLEAFPTVRHLAAADEEQVLRLWEGLGYYRRARQLHRAARLVVNEHGGRFPSDAEAVRRLPGIGRYTAGAILSIAYDAREPILEANTIRLVSRLLAFGGDPRGAEGQRLLWAAAEQLLPQRGAGTFNQALMELGSRVCTPRSPRCEECPVASMCPTFAGGLQDEIPRRAAKPNVEHVRQAAVVVRRRREVLLVRYGEQGRWAGLWDFPRFDVADEPRGPSQVVLAEGVKRLTGVNVGTAEKLVTLTHGVTRFRIRLDCHVAAYLSGRRKAANGNTLRWVHTQNLAEYPLSVTGRKLSRLIVDG